MGAQGVACEITQAQRLRIGQHIHRMVLPLTNKLVSEPPLYIYIYTRLFEHDSDWIYMIILPLFTH
jgi:hypothetical protein